MVKTIFYFADNLPFEDYLEQLRDGDIACRTIVFAKELKSIYMGGEMYGGWDDDMFKRVLIRVLNSDDIINALIQFIKNNRNDLPIATKTDLGAIMVGAFLAIAENGSLSVDINSLFGDASTIDKIKNIIRNYFSQQDPTLLPIASKESFGIVKIGDGLNVADGTISVDFDSISDTEKGDLAEIVLNFIRTNSNFRASTTNYGVVKIGEGIDVDNGVISVKFSDLPSTTQDELLNLIYQFFQNKSNLRASTTQYGVVKIDPNGGILVNDGVISVDSSTMLSQLDQSIVSMTATRTGDQNNIVIEQNNNNNSPLSVDITSLVQNIINNTEGGSVPGLNYAITDFVSNGTMLTISQNNNTDKSVNIEDAVKQSIQNFIDNGDTIINNFGEKTQVSVVPLFNSSTGATKIATITVDGDAKELWIPAGTGGGDNPGGGSEPYDDTDIKNAIKALQDRADSTELDLRDLLDETEEEVREKFKNAFSTYEDLIDYYKQTGDTTPTKFTFGKEDADEWASQMGLITPNGDGTYNVGWSTLTQTYDSLAGEVAQIKANQSAGGEIDYEALAAGLYAYIDENAATSGMDSTWGKFVTTDDDNIQMLEWMQAAIKTYASDQQAYSRLLAAAKDYDENGDTIQEGIARIHAFVEKDSNGDYVAGTSLASMIEDGVNNSLSEVYTENHPDSAVAGLYARLKTAEENATGARESISGLITTVDGKLAKADLVTALKNKKDEVMSASGLDISASINAATSNLSSQIEGTYAKISTTVTKDPNTKKIESGITISADQIELEGTTFADKLIPKRLVSGADGSKGLSIGADSYQSSDSSIRYGILGNNGYVSSPLINIGSPVRSSVKATGRDVNTSSTPPTTMEVSEFGSNGREYSSVLGAYGLTIRHNSSGDTWTGYTHAVDAYVTDTTAKVYVGENGGSSTEYTPTGAVTSSDIRKKNIVENVNLPIESIAESPIFKYKFKDSTNDSIYIGTSAQYWQEIIPEVVSTDQDGYLMMNYTSLNTVASLTSAKEIVKLKEENATLRQRVEDLEARLQLIENKLNA